MKNFLRVFLFFCLAFVCLAALSACGGDDPDVTTTTAPVTTTASVTTHPSSTFLDYYPLPDGTFGVSVGRAKYLEEIVIPATYNGVAVTAILERAFSECPNLKSVVIPDSVTSIASDAFCNCKGLTSIVIPDSVTSIGNFAFAWCEGLTSVTIGNGVTSIGVCAFEGCTNLTSVTFENTVGWKAGSTSLSADDLANPSTAATYFRGTYLYSTWIRE